MSDQKYWKDFWNNNEIVNRDGVHQKVGRTIKGVAIEEERWNRTIQDIEKILSLNKNDDVLDIAAGAGAIAIPFAPKVNTYTALDISNKLLENLKQIPNITTVLADVLTVNLEKEKYSKVILYFALQHFTEKESLFLLKKIYDCLKPGGICLIGDIPNIECKFNFFNTPEREKVYFDSVYNNLPIIGTWFDKKFMQKAGAFIGFGTSVVLDQPVYHINSHYRFDLKLIK